MLILIAIDILVAFIGVLFISHMNALGFLIWISAVAFLSMLAGISLCPPEPLYN